VGRPDSARRSGTQQAAIVNSRWVQHKAITSAVYEGFGGLLSKGLYTTFALYIEIDPQRLDVNVHPSKREVRFADERVVYRLVAETVRRSLRQADGIPEMPRRAEGPALPPMRTRDGFGIRDRAPTPSVADADPVTWGRSESVGLEGEEQMALPLAVARARPEAGDGAEGAVGEGGEPGETAVTLSVWQLHRRYLLAHTKNGLIIVDQHRAHERVLYEEVLESFDASPGTGQRLLFPLTLDFGLAEIQTVREALPLLERIGFGIRDFGANTVVVDAIPVGLSVWEEGQLLRAVVQDLLDREAAGTSGSDERNPLERRLAASYAHYTSIQVGDGLSPPEMQGVIDRLFATREPFVCPQGHPTVIKMSLDELDRRFT
jgi:DNA mismatch repair protein MutL